MSASFFKRRFVPYRINLTGAKLSHYCTPKTNLVSAVVCSLSADRVEADKHSIRERLGLPARVDYRPRRQVINYTGTTANSRLLVRK